MLVAREGVVTGRCGVVGGGGGCPGERGGEGYCPVVGGRLDVG